MTVRATIRETHIGIVTNNEDDEQRGRIKVACATLMGVDTNLDPLEYPDFIDPIFPYLASSDGEASDAGWFFIPDVGVLVELELTVSSPGDDTTAETSIDANAIRWRACIPAKGVDSVAEDFKTNYPNRRGWKTGRGHLFFMDDTEDDEKISCQQVNKDGFSFWDFDKNGSFTMATSSGHLIFLDAVNGAVTILDSNSNMLSMGADGISLVDKGSNMLTMDGTDLVQIMAQAQVVFAASSVNVSGGVLSAGLSATASGVIWDNALGPSGKGGFMFNLAAGMGEIATGLAAIPSSSTLTGLFVTDLAAGLWTSTKIVSEGE